MVKGLVHLLGYNSQFPGAEMKGKQASGTEGLDFHDWLLSLGVGIVLI